MFCEKCGTEIIDGTRFCHRCGAPVTVTPVPAPAPQRNIPSVPAPQQNIPPVPAPAPRQMAPYTPTPTPAPRQKPPRKPVNSKKLIPLIAVAAVLILVVTAACIFFGNPATQLARAFLKSGKAFASAAESTGLTDLEDVFDRTDSSQYLSVSLEEMVGYRELEGLGIHLNHDFSMSDRKIGTTLTAFYGSSDLLSIHAKFDNDQFLLGSPQLTQDTFYMISTTALGDLFSGLLEIDELSGVSFNIFDLYKRALELTEGNEEAREAVIEAGKALLKAVEVKKGKRETINVNGTNLSCSTYRVRIKKAAVRDFLNALEDALQAMDSTDATLELLSSAGFPAEMLDEVEYALEDSQYQLEEIFDALRDAANELGNIDLDVYVNKGYVVALMYEFEVDDVDAELVLSIGGGKNYVDDLSLRLTTEYGEMLLTSSGNHTGKGGVFTNDTILTLKDDYSKETLFQMELSYEPDAKDDNFSLQLEVDGVEISLEGLLSCGRDSFHLRLDEVEVDDTVTFRVEYRFEAYTGDNIPVADTVDVANLSMLELSQIVTKLYKSATTWASGLTQEFPDLIYAFY